MRPANSCRPCDSLGVSAGTRVGVLSANRPEVLHVGHAVQLLAGIYIPMHPLSGVADHLHVISDAQIEILIFDATRYQERAAELGKSTPGLRLVAFGASAIAEDICKLAERFTPARLVAPRVGPHDVQRLGYSGGTTGKPKSLASVHRTGLVTLQIMMAEWEWPNPPRVLSCTPLSHAGAALFMPTLLKNGTMLVLPSFEPVAVMQAIAQLSHQLHDARADDDLRAARSSALRRVRSVHRSRPCSTARRPSHRRG